MRRRRGFTLIELLTVIAIVTLLIGILVPSLSAARRRAKGNVCLSKMKGIATAFSVYLNENQDAFPPFRLSKLDPALPTDPANEYVNEYKAKSPRWHWFLEMGSGPVIDPKPFERLNRPWGDEGLGMEGSALGTTMTLDEFTCPALDAEEFAKDIRNGAYGYNYQYLGNTRQDHDPRRWDNFPVTSHKIKSPPQTVMIADSRGAGSPHGKHSYALDPPRLATEAAAHRFGPAATDLPPGVDAKQTALYQYSPVEMRHVGLGNVAFVDNHVEAKTLWDLGYEGDEAQLKKGTPQPIVDSTTAVRASNKLWNGQGIDTRSGSRNPLGGNAP